MAIIANVVSPVEPAVINVVIPRFAAFPVVPSAGGFCVDLEDGVEVPLVKLATPPLSLQGVLAAESPYLEPTLGQIWPRIG